MTAVENRYDSVMSDVVSGGNPVFVKFGKVKVLDSGKK